MELDNNSVSKTVLVTGASSGIGRAITEYLATSGDTVFAGARNDHNLRELDQLDRVTAVQLDVTNSREITAAIGVIQATGLGLDAVVNNAGILFFGPLVEISEEELYQDLNVNIMGVYRVTKACFPLLCVSQGRIVNITSISGFLAATFCGAYCMSKHAVEAYSDTLRMELQPFGIQVVVVGPGQFRSQMLGKTFEPATAKLPTTLFREALLERIKWAETGEKTFPDPDPVAEAVHHAIHANPPKPRYLPASQEITLMVLQDICQDLVNVNMGSNWELSLEELHDLLTQTYRKTTTP